MTGQQTFAASPRRARHMRINAMGLWAPALFFAAGGFYYFSVDAGDTVHYETRVLTLMITLVSAFGLFLIGAVLLLLVPTARDGRIDIDADGLTYAIGRHHAQYRWADMAEVTDDLALAPAHARRGRRPASLLLARPPGLPTKRRARTNLRHRAARVSHRPKQRGQTTLVPLAMFEGDTAHEISKAARAAHAQAIGAPQAGSVA